MQKRWVFFKTADMKLINNLLLDSLHNEKKFLADARFVENGNKKPVIIFVHGFKGFKDWGTFGLMADYFAEKGFVFFKLNFSHNGTDLDFPKDFVDLDSFSNNNFTIELDDLGVLIDYLYQNECSIPISEMDHQRIYLMGHSRGGSVVILKAREDVRINKIATLAAISDLQKMYTPDTLDNWKKSGITYVFNSRTQQNMPMKYQIVENYYQNRARLDVPSAVKDLKIPFLAFHGTADETVPAEHGREIKSWNSKVKLVMLEGASHTFGGAHPWEEYALPEHSRIMVRKVRNFFIN